VNIQNALRKRCDKVGRQQAHEAREAHQFDARPLQFSHNEFIVGFALQALRRYHLERNPSRRGMREPRRLFAVADHQDDFRAGNAPRRNAIGQRHEIRSAPRKQYPNAMWHKQKTLA